MYFYVFLPQKHNPGVILMPRVKFNPLRHGKVLYFCPKIMFFNILSPIYMLDSYMIHIFLCILTAITQFWGYFNAQSEIEPFKAQESSVILSKNHVFQYFIPHIHARFIYDTYISMYSDLRNTIMWLF